MNLPFTNRIAELKDLNAAAAAGGLTVVFGRRRVGKTRLLGEWLQPREGLYSQAIEAASGIQIGQVMSDIGEALETSIAPRNWTELLELLSLQKRRGVLCLDEFPYLIRLGCFAAQCHPAVAGSSAAKAIHARLWLGPAPAR